jgi:hypothetical protein
MIGNPLSMIGATEAASAMLMADAVQPPPVGRSMKNPRIVTPDSSSINPRSKKGPSNDRSRTGSRNPA